MHQNGTKSLTVTVSIACTYMCTARSPRVLLQYVHIHVYHVSITAMDAQSFRSHPTASCHPAARVVAIPLLTGIVPFIVLFAFE